MAHSQDRVQLQETSQVFTISLTAEHCQQRDQDTGEYAHHTELCRTECAVDSHKHLCNLPVCTQNNSTAS